MTAASPRTSPSALRSPLPPSITHSTRPSSVSPRLSRSCSRSVQITAFSGITREGGKVPLRLAPGLDGRQLLLEALPGPPHHCPTDGTLAALAAAPPAGPR